MRRLALVVLFLVGCGGDAFGTGPAAEPSDAAPAADVASPLPVATDAATDAMSSPSDDVAPRAAPDATAARADLDATAEVDAAPFCYLCQPGGAAGNYGYYVCGAECVMCGTGVVCRPDR